MDEKNTPSEERRAFLRGVAAIGVGGALGLVDGGCRDGARSPAASAGSPAAPAERRAAPTPPPEEEPMEPRPPSAPDRPTVRPLVAATQSRPTREGAGVHLRRAFGFQEEGDFDPFLLLDDFRGDDPARYRAGFPWHPHRGIETITYVLAGEVDHGDSLGNAGVIGPGDVQWMTAGSGIVHQEMPRGDAEGRMYGFQLWANLPARDKMMAPRYRDVTAAEIPVVELPDGVRVRVVAGTVAGRRGPVRDVVIEPEYLDVSVPPLTTFSHDTPRGHTAFAYVFEGEAAFGPAAGATAGANSDANSDEGPRHGNHTLLRFGDGDRVEVRTAAAPVRFLLVSGKPLGEPIAWRGPIVMNTEAELRQAFEEYRNGTFLK